MNTHMYRPYSERFLGVVWSQIHDDAHGNIYFNGLCQLKFDMGSTCDKNTKLPPLNIIEKVGDVCSLLSHISYRTKQWEIAALC